MSTIVSLVTRFFIFAALAVWRVMKRANVRDAQTALKSDRRKPIIYLRSFREDISSPLNPASRATHEEYLVSVLNEVGPVLAIGRPNERQAPPGAARSYARGGDWQGEVINLMKEAQFIVIHVDVTRGLRWEIATAVRLVKPERILLSLPYLRAEHRGLIVTNQGVRLKEYSDFRASMVAILPRPLPEQINDARFLCFDSDWTPLILNPPSRWKRMILGQLSPSRVGIRETIRPFFERAELNLSKTPTVLKGIGCAGFSLMIVFGWLMLLLALLRMMTGRY